MGSRKLETVRDGNKKVLSISGTNSSSNPQRAYQSSTTSTHSAPGDGGQSLSRQEPGGSQVNGDKTPQESSGRKRRNIYIAIVLGMAGLIVLLLLVALIVLASKGDDSKDDKRRPSEALEGEFCTVETWPPEEGPSTGKPGRYSEGRDGSAPPRLVPDGFGRQNCGKRAGLDYEKPPYELFSSLRNNGNVSIMRTENDTNAMARLWNGKVANQGDEPWFTLITSTQGGQELHCGGAWIHKNWIVTAAHCLKDGLEDFPTGHSSKNVEAYVGAYERYDEPQDGAKANGFHVRPDRCLIPPGYDGWLRRDGIQWDIGLLHIPDDPAAGSVPDPEAPFRLANTICLPAPGPETKQAPFGRPEEIIGLGRNEDGPRPKKLKYAWYPYFPGMCQNKGLGKPRRDLDGILCRRTPKIYLDKGDSGSPWMIQEKLNADPSAPNYEKYKNVIIGVQSAVERASKELDQWDMLATDLGYFKIQNWINDAIDYYALKESTSATDAAPPPLDQQADNNIAYNSDSRHRSWYRDSTVGKH